MSELLDYCSLAMLCSLVSFSPTAAQECRGFPSFHGQPIHISAGTLFGEREKAYAAGFAVGSRAGFGELQLGEIDLHAFDVSSFSAGAGAGLQFPMRPNAPAYLCPFTAVEFVRDPTGINDGTVYRKSSFSLGAAISIVSSRTQRWLEFHPTASVAYQNASSRFTSPTGPVSHSQAFALVSLGVGLVFGREVSVTPSVSNVFWVKSTATTVGIGIVFPLGGVRTLLPHSRPTSCAGLAATDSTVHDTTQVAERATLRSAPEPRYPLMDRGLGIGGRVVMEVIVEPDGTIDQSSVHVVDHVDPGIDRAAVRWIGEANYWPACRDGRPVRARIAQPLDFCVAGCPQTKSR